MGQMTGESWRFEVRCSEADGVYLMNEVKDICTNCLPMVPLDEETWSLELKLVPGRYKMSYYTMEGTTLFQRGTLGLTGTRTSRPDPRVIIEPMEQPVPA
jgi:hypothetical protein